jgi:hypothetical protein
VSVPATKHPRGDGIAVHRRAAFEVTRHRGIPVTTPACTVVDIAPGLTRDELERAINQADLLGLITVAHLRSAAEDMPQRPGRPKVCRVIDQRTFRFTRSRLEAHLHPDSASGRVAETADAPVGQRVRGRLLAGVREENPGGSE